jgi:3-oxoacyl-[acyl-carrier protein] reductase
MSIPVDLHGQVAFVTGAGRGIGEAIARAFAGSGAAVALVARTTSEVEAVAADIRAAGGAALAVPADVVDPGAMGAAIERTVGELGRLDLVVANAGAVAAPEPRGPVEDFAYVLDVNLGSVHTLARLAEPHLRADGGKFIVMGSGAGRRPFPAGAGYSVSKAGVAMLVRCLAVEWRPANIAVNEIVPGPVRTAMASNVLGDLTGMPPNVQMDWHKDPADVAPLALFLAGLPNNGPSGQTFSLLGRDG